MLLIRSLRVPRSAPTQVKLWDQDWFQVLESKQTSKCRGTFIGFNDGVSASDEAGATYGGFKLSANEETFIDIDSLQRFLLCLLVVVKLSRSWVHENSIDQNSKQSSDASGIACGHLQILVVISFTGCNQGIAPAVGTDTDLNKKWMDSSFNGYEAGPESTLFRRRRSSRLLDSHLERSAKRSQVIHSNGSGGGGHLSDSDAPRIDPGTGAFTIIAVCKLIMKVSPTLVKNNNRPMVLVHHQRVTFFSTQITSNGSSNPSTLVISAKCGNSPYHTPLNLNRTSQVFDEDAFMFGYDRDSSGNANSSTMVLLSLHRYRSQRRRGRHRTQKFFCQVVFKTTDLLRLITVITE